MRVLGETSDPYREVLGKVKVMLLPLGGGFLEND